MHKENIGETGIKMEAKVSQLPRLWNWSVLENWSRIFYLDTQSASPFLRSFLFVDHGPGLEEESIKENPL